MWHKSEFFYRINHRLNLSSSLTQELLYEIKGAVLMKRLFSISLMIYSIIAFASCAIAKPSPSKNVIAPASLSSEQKEIIDLLSARQEALLFDFHTDELYRGFELWVEIYHYGKLIERPAGISA
jgi:hypothetical protein